jgi:hypothetical protein
MSPLTRVAAVLIVAALLAEAFWWAPPQRPDQTDWLIRLMTGDWAEEEPLVVALFDLMGVWPMAMLALLSPWLRRRPIPLWPFAVGSFALGAFVLLPGLALGGAPLPMASWQRALGSRWFAGCLLVPALGLMGWGLVNGSPEAFVAAWQSEQFVHVMAFDFLALWATSVLVARDQGGRWWWAAIPLVGALAYRLLSDPPSAEPVEQRSARHSRQND